MARDRYDELKQIDMAFQATLAEYDSIREASLSRDQIIGTLNNFIMVVLAAAIASAPVVIAQKLFWLLLVFSIVISGIALTRQRQAWLQNVLARYEQRILKPRLMALILQTNPSQESTTSLSNLWQWQAYYREQFAGSFASTVTHLLIFSGLETLLVILPWGFLLLFFYYRNVTTLAFSEIILSLLAGVYATLTIVATAYRIVNLRVVQR